LPSLNAVSFFIATSILLYFLLQMYNNIYQKQRK
jgi:hypothetical protein